MGKSSKIGIVGCGNVGATIAYTLMMRASCKELVLIDIHPDKAHGEAMDLNHCLPFLSPMRISAGNYQELDGAEIVILSAGVSQRPGETRIDLVARNAAVLQSCIPQITAAAPDCILLVVSNPVDILTYVSLKLSGFPESRVIGSGTVLDTARLKYLVGKKLGVDYRNVHSFIIGEHGDSELAVWSGANVSGINLDDFCPLCDTCEDMAALHLLYDDVKNSAYEIIRGKGATYYAIAQATQRILDAILGDEDSILPVSCYLSGQYGVSDLCMSVPAIVGRSGIKHVLDIPLNHEESENMLRSAEILRDVTGSLKLNA